MNVGDLVEHKHYGRELRGVVVDLDFDGDPIIYFLYRPERGLQPWYKTSFRVIS